MAMISKDGQESNRLDGSQALKSAGAERIYDPPEVVLYGVYKFVQDFLPVLDFCDSLRFAYM